MNRPLINDYRERFERLLGRLRARVAPWREKLVERWGETRVRESAAERLQRVFSKARPPLEITRIQPPTLLVLMAGTSVQQYEQAGQLGRLSAFLERHAKYFRTVLLMSTDRHDYTPQFDSPRVRHIRRPLVVPSGPGSGMALLISALVRFKTVRKATSIVILDEESAATGWLASRLSGSRISLSMGAPWAPPRHMNIDGKRRWLVRAALRRVEQIVRWPGAENEEFAGEAEVLALPELIDADMFCPLTTTDPARPRTVGVFLGTENEAETRVMLGVAERLARRRQGAVLRVFVSGHGAESRASALRSEVAERGMAIEFQVLPRIEMLPDAIARLRMCVAFNDSESIRGLLRAMASGVPGIAVGQEPTGDDSEPPGWSRFVLHSGPTEEEITRNIEMLFREPGVRLRMAREGRRFVIASHSIEALSAIESKHLLGPDDLDVMSFVPEPEFDADAEAEKLAQMLEGLGVMRSDSDGEMETAA